MYQKLLLSICLCSLLASCSQTNSTQQEQKSDISMDMLEQTRQNLAILVKDSVILQQIQLNEEGLFVYASPSDFRNNQPELHLPIAQFEQASHLVQQLSSNLFWQTLLDFPPSDSIKTNRAQASQLAGCKIVLDAGHVAATLDTAQELEGKYVKMHESALTDFQEISFNEANLTLATAYALKKKLEAAGAEVLLTRTETGRDVRGLTYFEWRRDSFEVALEKEEAAGRLDSTEVKWFQNKATEEQIYQKLFVRRDLLARAEKINAFQPDLSIIIHYNVHMENWGNRDSEGFFEPTNQNYHMAFIPGSFMAGELELAADRAEFVRLLFSDDISESTLLSEQVVKAFNKHLDIPPVGAGEEDPPIYIPRACVKAAEGVYARNLSLTRLVHGPVCYGESLCQDNVEEAIRLNLRDTTIHGIKVSSRVLDVVDAYYEGIQNYLALPKDSL